MAADFDTSGISVSASIESPTVVPAKGIAGRYSQLDGVRNEILDRGREASALTIPSILPPQGNTENTGLRTPFQSVGARTTNNLANKLLLTLFPVSTPFFKLEVSEGTLTRISEAGNPDIKLEVEKVLSQQEAIIQSDMEISGMRPRLFEALRHIIITGNFLLYIPKKGEPIGYRMDQYVVKRSHSGKVLEIMVREHINENELEPSWKEQLRKADALHGTNKDESTASKSIYDMYTRIYLEDKKYHEQRYINNVALEGTSASYKEKESAWIPLRWNGVSGEDYGRSYVDEYLGDFRSLEGLTKAVIEHAAISSKIFGMLRPNSMITPKDLERVVNGGFITGDPEDLVFPEIGKYNDMQVAQQNIERLTLDLSRAFLLTQVRDSERTTAEEIRMQASELETALGGAYSLLASTFQEPLLNRQISRLIKSGELKKVNNQKITPKVIVGMEGLGRGTDLDKLMRAVTALSTIGPASQFIPDLKMEGVAKFVFNAVGLDPTPLIKSEEEKAAEATAQQQAQQQEQVAQTMGDVMKASAGPAVAGAMANPENVQPAMEAIRGAMPQQTQPEG